MITLQTKSSDGVVIVSVDIEQLDAGVATDFAEKLKSISGEHLNIIMDLQLLQFIDSSGVGAILGVKRKVHSAGGCIKLAELSEPVESIFGLMNMDRILDIFPTVNEALASFES